MCRVKTALLESIPDPDGCHRPYAYHCCQEVETYHSAVDFCIIEFQHKKKQPLVVEMFRFEVSSNVCTAKLTNIFLSSEQ